ncbi:MAG: class I SAM-dependent methyltransferase [Chloroflexaceae bacterium]|nr:class I SAM-dependent methyltransferase [Chloroflexaceae bacterium]
MTRRINAPLLALIARRQRYQHILPFLHGHVLDVGCGGGLLAGYLPAGTTYSGIDTNPQVLAWARKHHPPGQFYQLDLEQQALPPAITQQRFDTVVAIALLEHLAQPQHLVVQLRQVLAPAGRLVVTTPTPIGHRVHALLTRPGWFYRDAAEEHQSVLDARSLQTMACAAGLRMIHYRRFALGCNQCMVVVPATG